MINETRSIEEQLAAQGLRLARANESGWYTLVVDEGVVERVWATDELAEVVS